MTLLAGFLGAGKTTLLKRLLENRNGLRVGVVVNDVASVNVDAQLVTSHLAGSEGVEVAQLENGCVCCSLSDDLFASISALMSRAPEEGFHHLLVELSGVSEPAAVRQNWTVAREVGHPAAMRCEIDRVVTVVDASCFADDWYDGGGALGRNAMIADGGAERPVVELLATQIEAADVILLNKADLASEAQLQQAEALLAGLNSTAEVLRAEFGGADPAALLPASPRRLAAAPAHGTAPAHGGDGDCSGHDHHGHGHGHAHVHSHAGSSPAERYGIGSFVYRARRPFDSARFQAFVDSLPARRGAAAPGAAAGRRELALAGLLRAKGTCWLSGAPLHEHTWSFAGLTSTLARGNPWWAACEAQHVFLRAAYPGMQDIFDRLMAEAWDTEEGGWGDRRQELVFIGGPGLDEAALRAELDRCLLAGEEYAAFETAYRSAKAPFECNLGNGVSMRLG